MIFQTSSFHLSDRVGMHLDIYEPRIVSSQPTKGIAQYFFQCWLLPWRICHIICDQSVADRARKLTQAEIGFETWERWMEANLKRNEQLLKWKYWCNPITGCQKNYEQTPSKWKRLTIKRPILLSNDERKYSLVLLWKTRPFTTRTCGSKKSSQDSINLILLYLRLLSFCHQVFAKSAFYCISFLPRMGLSRVIFLQDQCESPFSTVYAHVQRN